jgi:limonene-1,2-epoxide hydrolase
VNGGDVSQGSEEVVRQFCTLVSKRDAEALRSVLDDDIVYHNIGMEASRGIEATLANVGAQWEMFPGTYEYEIRNIAANGDMVLTERVDKVGPPGMVAPVPVMGVFEVRAGKIVAWRDYFDPGLAGKLLAGEDASELIS